MTLRLLLPILLLFFHQPVHGTMVLPLTAAQMGEQAERVFWGLCLDSSTDLDERGIPSTFVRFRVLEGIKGSTTNEEILVKFHGVGNPLPVVREGQRALVPMKLIGDVAGGDGYAEGVEYLLFLYPESHLGFTSPVGGGQGKWDVIPDQGGGKKVLPPLIKGNAHQAALSIGGKGGPGGGIPIEEVVKGLRKMVEND